MVSSMTGYGRATQSNHTHTVTVELKSVNHRYLEITFNHPRQLLYLEDDMKRVIKNVVQRGSITIFITIAGEPLSETRMTVNWELLDQFISNANSIAHRYTLNSDLNISDIFQFSDVFEVKEQPKEDQEVDALILSALEEAVGNLQAMRLKEGLHLKEDLLSKLSEVEKNLQIIRDFTPVVVEEYRKRIEHRVRDFLSGRADIDDERLLNEVAVFSDKANIDEELTRLVSHTQQFKAFLEESGPIGRKIDFLIQEMNREINTIGSKANDIHIARKVVEIKSELEKMREQVQNIE